MSAKQTWTDSLQQQIEFYLRSRGRARKDAEFEWKWYESNRQETLLGVARHHAHRVLTAVGLRRSQFSYHWFQSNSGHLWEARQLLEDDLSKLLFDTAMVVRCTSHRKFYFPRIDYDDLIEVSNRAPFAHADLPTEYLGLPLYVFDARVANRSDLLKLISPESSLHLFNSYRQYFARRGPFELGPARGDIVLDCGACIGETSVIFGSIVGAEGEVHLFDPIPIHIRFCNEQAVMNPAVARTLHINTLAVGDVTRAVSGSKADAAQISPGGLAIDSFAMTRIDDYAKNLRRVDFIKMDIEGAEMSALSGAAGAIQEYQPRLAISAYHKYDDLWVIPDKIKSLNSRYKLFFGHHSPIAYESVYYALNSP